MDLFSTNSMLKAVYELPMNNNFLLKRFFPDIQQHHTNEISFDVVKKARRLAPFVSPVVAGQIVLDQGYETKTFEPAYIKDKRIFDASRALKRAAGETIGGSFDGSHRIERLLVDNLNDQIGMIDLRLEVMASEVLRTGAVTIVGEKYPMQNVNFGRDAALTLTLSGAQLWNDPASSPLDDLQDWSQTLMQKSGVFCNDVVMTLDVWRIFRKHPDVAAELDRFRGKSTMSTAATNEEGGVFMGDVHGFNIYVYSGWYIDDSGVEQAIIPVGSVILSGPKMDGVRAFGAIRDEEAGFQALPYFPKSWLDEDPSVRYLMMQSAPLLVPTRVDATLYASVL